MKAEIMIRLVVIPVLFGVLRGTLIVSEIS